MNLNSGNSTQILHIDDDPSFTRLVARALGTQGFEVESLNDPLNWKEAVDRSNHRLVICDLEMPRISGLEVLREIKRYDSGVMVIMLTGLVSLSTVVESHGAGAEYCFFKPITNFGPLANAIQDSIRRLEHWRQAIITTSIDRAKQRREIERLTSAT